MKSRFALSAVLAFVAACALKIEPRSASRLVLTPALDSMFIDGQLLKRQVTFYDEHGTVTNPGVVQWSSGDTTVLAVDGVTGEITGRKAGVATVIATAQGTQGLAAVVVSPALKTTILIDSLYLLAGDTVTVPVQTTHAAAGTPTVWFTAPANGVFAIDSSSGRITATAVGGPARFIAHAILDPDTVADSGTVEVVQLTDTSGGQAYYNFFWTNQRSRRVSVRATTYPRTGGQPTFQLDFPTYDKTTVVEAVDIVLRSPPPDPGAYVVDSISLSEASNQANPFCQPPRNWGRWFTITGSGRIDALSLAGGRLVITQIVPVANGFAISGQFYLPAQPTNVYNDPTGALPIRGSFVAPLIDITGRC